MLLEKFLPQYTHRTQHTILIKASREKIVPLIDELDLSGSAVIRFLFWLRGMPPRMLNKAGLNREKFIELEKTDHELVLGLIGQFWKPSGNLQHFKPQDFLTFHQPGFVKAAWNFRLIERSADTFTLETETRIYCTDEWSRRKFARYWFFIRPFSGWVRKEMLRTIKNKAES